MFDFFGLSLQYPVNRDDQYVWLALVARRMKSEVLVYVDRAIQRTSKRRFTTDSEIEAELVSSPLLQEGANS